MPSRRVDRRSFLKTAGAFTAGAVLARRAAARSAEHTAAASSLAVRPFGLTQVSLGGGIFRQKRDRILHFARFYGGEEELAGPDRLLSNFRANACGRSAALAWAQYRRVRFEPRVAVGHDEQRRTVANEE